MVQLPEPTTVIPRQKPVRAAPLLLPLLFYLTKLLDMCAIGSSDDECFADTEREAAHALGEVREAEGNQEAEEGAHGLGRRGAGVSPSLGLQAR